MRTKHPSRREFLLQSGIALTGIAAAFRLSPQTPADSHTGAKLRGLMLDAARVPESLAYYRRVIDFCADWELNALQFRIADDQGCAIRFSSIPDLLFHDHAFSPEELHDLTQYANGRGVDLIPELESFGHTGYITRSPAYAHLLDADAQQPSEFTGVMPTHPETLPLFENLYREIATIFPSVYLHGGCDEVNWGGSPLSRKALETKQRYQIWADYLNSLNHIAEDLQKQFIVWGDMVLHKEPRILARLSKTIIMMDWNYAETNSSRLQGTLSKIRKNGSRAIGAPAFINYQWGPRPGSDQLANIDAFADAYLTSNDPRSLGVILTNWVPSRYIQNSIWDGFAYAAVAFTKGSSAAQSSGFQRFVENHYSADWNNDWDEAFRMIYSTAPKVHERKASADAISLRVPWSSDEQLASVLTRRSAHSNPFTRLHSLLRQLKDRVSKNREDFQAFLLSVAYLEHVYWREEVVAESAAKKALAAEESASLITNIRDRDSALAEALSKDWDQGRFSDSSAKSRPLFGFEPKDQLVFQFQCAADYSASLASHPDRFFQLLTAAKPA